MSITFLDFRDICKISDFGLSKSEDLAANTAATINQTEYTPAWSAPGMNMLKFMNSS